jgi:hypothetical protein
VVEGELLPGADVMLRYQVVPGSASDVVQGMVLRLVRAPQLPTPLPSPTPVRSSRLPASPTCWLGRIYCPQRRDFERNCCAQPGHGRRTSVCQLSDERWVAGGHENFGAGGDFGAGALCTAAGSGNGHSDPGVGAHGDPCAESNRADTPPTSLPTATAGPEEPPPATATAEPTENATATPATPHQRPPRPRQSLQQSLRQSSPPRQSLQQCLRQSSPHGRAYSSAHGSAAPHGRAYSRAHGRAAPHGSAYSSAYSSAHSRAHGSAAPHGRAHSRAHGRQFGWQWGVNGAGALFVSFPNTGSSSLTGTQRGGIIDCILHLPSV